MKTVFSMKNSHESSYSPCPLAGRRLGRDILRRTMIFGVLVLGLIGICLSATAAVGQGNLPAPSNRLESKIEEFRKLWNIPGLAVGIVKNDHVVFEKGFGYRDIENRLPVTPETQFCIASITKSFTSLAAAILVDEKKLDWDRPVAEYLPNFRLYDDYPSLHATLRDLLAHRTGLAESAALYYVFPRDREELSRRLRYVPPKYEFRSKYFYTNISYIIAGRVIEKAAQTPYEELVSERIFKRLGMTSSQFSLGREPTADFAWPYRGRMNTPVDHVFNEKPVGNPAGGIQSNLTDMLKYIRFQLNGGQVGNQALISQESAKEIRKPQMPVDYFEGTPLRGINDYGLGWQIETYRNRILFHHGGWIEGYVCWASFIPSERTGVVVLSNKKTLLPFLLSWWIYDQLSGVRGEEIENLIKGNAPEEKEGSGALEATAGAGTVDKRIIGIYENDLFGEAAVDVDPKTQGLSVRFNREITVPLYRQDGDFYLAKNEIPEFDGLSVLFNFHYAGNIKSFEIPFYRNMEPVIFEWKAPLTAFDERYLSRFAGDYDFQGAPVVIRRAENTLLVKVGDQPEAALSPLAENFFEMTGGGKIIIKFDRFDDQGKAMEALVYLPEGIARAKRVK
jgi:CubicO group peptidase (beta-lactamase class C family)